MNSYSDYTAAVPRNEDEYELPTMLCLTLIVSIDKKRSHSLTSGPFQLKKVTNDSFQLSEGFLFLNRNFPNAAAPVRCLRATFDDIRDDEFKWEMRRAQRCLSRFGDFIYIHIAVEASKSSGKGLIEKLLSVCTHLINWPTMTGSIGWMSRVYCRFLKMKFEDFLFCVVLWQIVAVKSSLLLKPLMCVLFLSFKFFFI